MGQHNHYSLVNIQSK